MGFIEKLKNAFKKKNKGEGAAAEAAAPKKAKGAAGKRSAQFADVAGDVGKSLRFAADKIDAKVEAGTMTERSAEIFMGGLVSIQQDTASADEAKLIAISQVIGGIINA